MYIRRTEELNIAIPEFLDLWYFDILILYSCSIMIMSNTRDENPHFFHKFKD